VVKVVAAENFWGDIARQIGGDHVDVTSIVNDPSTDPHQYESDARDAAAVADARLVVVNGAGYDDFIDKLLSNTSHKGRVVFTVAEAMQVKGKPDNPHFWYAVERAPGIARAIGIALAHLDRADRSTFVTNLKTFTASLAPVRRLVATIRSRYRGAPVAYTERVPEYLLDEAGLQVVTPAGFARAIEDGNEPSAGDAQAMDDLITQHRIKALIYNAQATSAVTQHVQELARQNRIPVVPMTETMPKNESSYQAWQQHQLEALATALGG
jgi:zinc/manganese transport system substrate-binding protein